MIRLQFRRTLRACLAALALLGANPAVSADVVTTSAGAGFRHGCALSTTGGVKCQGMNGMGQLGDGTINNRAIPGDVTGLSSGVAALAVGVEHACALKTTGAVMCWGKNGSGQLGDGTLDNGYLPVNVVGLSSGVASIAAGENHTCAITTGGAVKCWGANHGGQVGDGTLVDRPAPVDVPGLAGILAVAGGDTHTCALTANRGVKCWGRNNGGQLGDGTTVQRMAPVDVSGAASGVAGISSGAGHMCLVTTAGAAKCWGLNSAGQLGDGTQVARSTPVIVTGFPVGAAAITASGDRTCLVTTGGGAKCWGVNLAGQLGDGTTSLRLTPVNVAGLTSGVAAITAGPYNACAITTGGVLKCWGPNDFGQIGNGSTVERLTPGFVSGPAHSAVAIARGSSSNHNCVLNASGGVRCWGNNEGFGASEIPSGPVDIAGLASGAAAVAVGVEHTCVATTGGAAKCWGVNGAGEVGDGTQAPRSTPFGVAGLASGVADITAGYWNTCVVTTDGGARCWGYGFNGANGDGTTDIRFMPVDVFGLTSGVAAITAGTGHACALTTGGGVRCWGNGSSGQLGDGADRIFDPTLAQSVIPVHVMGLASGVTAITAGTHHTCALTTAGGVKCWGLNLAQQLGIGFGPSSVEPVDVSGHGLGIVAIAAGGTTTCALNADGEVSCWGSETGISGLTGVAAIMVGDAHSCALMKDGTVKCSGGSSFYGQLGDGTNDSSSEAVDTLFFTKTQSLAFLPPASGLTGVSMGLTATATSSLPATFDSWTPTTCSVSGTTVTPLAVGLCGVRASQAGNAAFAPATQQLRLIAVAKGPQAIAFTSTPPAVGIAGGAAYAATAAGGGSSSPITFSIDASSTPSACTIAGATVSFTGAGTCVVNANRAGDANYTAAPQVQQSIAVLLPPVVSLDTTSVAFGTQAMGTTSGSMPVKVTNTGGSTLTVSGVSIDNASFTQANNCSSVAPLASCTVNVSFTPATAAPIAGQLSIATNAPGSPHAVSLSGTGQKQPQAIAFTSTPPAVGVVGGATYTLGATGGASPSPVTFSVAGTSTPGACAIAGTTVSFTGAGTCVISANQAGDANYSAAPQVQQSITVQMPPSALSLDKTSLAFGAQSMATTSPAMSVTVTNTGGSTLTVSGISIANAQFTQANNCASVAPSASCTVNVYFSPAIVGGALNSTAPVAGTLSIASSAAGSPHAVALTGTAQKSLVTHYYGSILGRSPDAGGAAFWASEAARVAQLGANVNEVWFALSASFYFSPEYLALNRNPSQFVTDLYRTFFNREPDSGGLDFWVGQMAGGMPREVVLVSYMFSTEFGNFTRAIFGDTAARAEVDAVMDFYRSLLARLPDDGGFNYWVGQFRAAQCSGAAAVTTEVEAISSAFALSAEYAGRGRTNAQYVGDLYNAFLRRGGDLGGVQFWIGQIDSAALTREQVRQTFLASGEFQARVANIVSQGCQR